MCVQSEKRNLSMMMDLYEMTMANGYFYNEPTTRNVVFDVFYRRNPDEGGYAIFAGLEQIIEYVLDLHFDEEDIEYFRSLNLFGPEFVDYLRDFHFTGELRAFPEGTVMYPQEPIITIIAPVIEAQIIETAVLAQMNHQSLIATKTNRIVQSARGRGVSDFGARRAHNMDAAVYGARAAYIGGANGTATVLAGKMFHIPVSGTMAHSWVSYYKDEYQAFVDYAKVYPNQALFLVDTYDVIRSGVPNAIRVAKEVLEPAGHRLKGVRIDSGDLAYLSKQVRKMLDDAGCQDAIIVGSNSLDEYTITSIIDEGGQFDSFGVGERLITAKSDPVFGGVYKLAAVQQEDGTFEPRIKISESPEKITNPGLKEVYRIYNGDHAVCDLITKSGETVDLSGKYRYVDPNKPWKNRFYENCTAKKLQKVYIKDGKLVEKLPDIESIKAFVAKQLSHEIWPEEQRFYNPHRHYLDMSPEYYEMKMTLLNDLRQDD